MAAGVIPPTLPPSVEEAYRKKCVELKRRMTEVEQSNDSFRLRKNRLLRGIRKIRLERTILLDLLGKRMRKNGDDGYYDDDSENSSEIPATPNDKPLRNKRSHRRPVASSPPMLSQPISGPIAAAHQHRQSALAPYQPHHEISFPTVQTPNGVSHLQSHPSHPELYSTHNLLPSGESQIPYPASAFEYFLDDQFYQTAQAQNFRNEEEVIEAAHAAWSKLSPEQIDTYVEHWTHNLTRWRQAMEEVARQTGEPPRGQTAAGAGAGRLDGAAAQRESEMAQQRDREVERQQREIEMEDQAPNEDSKRVASSGFTSIN